MTSKAKRGKAKKSKAKKGHGVNGTRTEEHIQEYGRRRHEGLIEEGQKTITITIAGVGSTRFKDVLGDTETVLEDGTFEIRDRRGKLYMPSVQVAKEDDKYLAKVVESAKEYYIKNCSLRQKNVIIWLNKHFNGNIELYLTNERWILLKASIFSESAIEKFDAQQKEIATLKRGQTTLRKGQQRMKDSHNNFKKKITKKMTADNKKMVKRFEKLEKNQATINTATNTTDTTTRNTTINTDDDASLVPDDIGGEPPVGDEPMDDDNFVLFDPVDDDDDDTTPTTPGQEVVDSVHDDTTTPILDDDDEDEFDTVDDDNEDDDATPTTPVQEVVDSLHDDATTPTPDDDDEGEFESPGVESDHHDLDEDGDGNSVVCTSSLVIKSTGNYGAIAPTSKKKFRIGDAFGTNPTSHFGGEGEFGLDPLMINEITGFEMKSFLNETTIAKSKKSLNGGVFEENPTLLQLLVTPWFYKSKINPNCNILLSQDNCEDEDESDYQSMLVDINDEPPFEPIDKDMPISLDDYITTTTTEEEGDEVNHGVGFIVMAVIFIVAVLFGGVPDTSTTVSSSKAIAIMPSKALAIIGVPNTSTTVPSSIAVATMPSKALAIIVPSKVVGFVGGQSSLCKFQWSTTTSTVDSIEMPYYHDEIEKEEEPKEDVSYLRRGGATMTGFFAEQVASSRLTFPNSSLPEVLKPFSNNVTVVDRELFNSSYSHTKGLKQYRFLLSSLQGRRKVDDHFAIANDDASSSCCNPKNTSSSSIKVDLYLSQISQYNRKQQREDDCGTFLPPKSDSGGSTMSVTVPLLVNHTTTKKRYNDKYAYQRDDGVFFLPVSESSSTTLSITLPLLVNHRTAKKRYNDQSAYPRDECGFFPPLSDSSSNITLSTTSVTLSFNHSTPICSHTFDKYNNWCI